VRELRSIDPQELADSAPPARAAREDKTVELEIMTEKDPSYRPTLRKPPQEVKLEIERLPEPGEEKTATGSGIMDKIRKIFGS
jgi:hypothetical protein